MNASRFNTPKMTDHVSPWRYGDEPKNRPYRREGDQWILDRIRKGGIDQDHARREARGIL